MERYSEYKDSGVQWLGKIPGHWRCVRMKNICTGFSNGTSAEQIEYSDKTVPVTRIETISKGYVNYNKVGYIEKTDKISTYQLQIGDILFSHINSYERVGNTALYNGEKPLYHGMNLMRIIPLPKFTHYKYVHYYLRSPLFLKQVQLKCKPAINQVSIPGKYVKDLRLNLPPLSEQHSIVSYLDDKCGKIDKMLEGKQKQIELLAEMKQRIIADAVTRGLNPDVKMKATNIPWLPQIPEHWEEKRMASLFTGDVETNKDFEYKRAFKFNYGQLVPKNEMGEPEEYREVYVKYWRTRIFPWLTSTDPHDCISKGIDLYICPKYCTFAPYFIKV